MIVAFLTAKLASLGIPDRFREFLSWAILTLGGIIITCALVWFWLHQHDKRVIENHEAKIDAQVSEKAADASQYADDQDAQRRAEMGQAQSDTRKAMNDAEAKNPDAAKAPAGPVTRAVGNSLRDRADKTGSASH